MKKLLIGLLALGSLSAFAGNCRVLSPNTGIQTVSFDNGIITINETMKLELNKSSKRCALIGPKNNVQFYGEQYDLRVSMNDCNKAVSGLTGQIIDEANNYRITDIICY